MPFHPEIPCPPKFPYPPILFQARKSAFQPYSSTPFTIPSSLAPSHSPNRSLFPQTAFRYDVPKVERWDGKSAKSGQSKFSARPKGCPIIEEDNGSMDYLWRSKVCPTIKGRCEYLRPLLDSAPETISQRPAQGVSIYLRQDQYESRSRAKGHERQQHNSYHSNASETSYQDNIRTLSINSIMKAINGSKGDVESEQSEN
ncbi:13787_t:CDS:2 [Acaulospora colombiana]|uniref:13787_t:CDS:1 n=1 Tax=Acaulospora colombiana TaxID=27376 RepID=A0ACA9N9E9_9GLOM|nr:13787_t:CDS:2 [Acaulospora colombiana]